MDDEPVAELPREPSLKTQLEPPLVPTSERTPLRGSITSQRRGSAEMSIKSKGSAGSPKLALKNPSVKSEQLEDNAEIVPSANSAKPEENVERFASSPSTKSAKLEENVEKIASSPSTKSAKLEATVEKFASSPSTKSAKLEQNLEQAVSQLEPQGKRISDHVDELTNTVLKLTEDPSSPVSSNIEKIARMSKVLTNEANALRESIKGLSNDLARSKKEVGEDVNFPYHLFLIELIVNKIHMKCECFELDFNNLVLSATFLGKSPIVLYDSTYGAIESFSKLNVGKSTLFAMTYDKICAIKEFEIYLQLTKQPPCTSCITKIAETRMDYTKEFTSLREELCKKWIEQKPQDNIICTTSTPLSKTMFYLTCGENCESIGVIEVSMRMSFLGKEITTAFCAAPKPKGTSMLMKDDNGMTMYSCQKVEMDEQGKVLLDENVLGKKDPPCTSTPTRRSESPMSQISSRQVSSKRSIPPHSTPYPSNQGMFNFVKNLIPISMKKLYCELR